MVRHLTSSCQLNVCHINSELIIAHSIRNDFVIVTVSSKHLCIKEACVHENPSQSYPKIKSLTQQKVKLLTTNSRSYSLTAATSNFKWSPTVSVLVLFNVPYRDTLLWLLIALHILMLFVTPSSFFNFNLLNPICNDEIVF